MDTLIEVDSLDKRFGDFQCLLSAVGLYGVGPTDPVARPDGELQSQRLVESSGKAGQRR
jgi:hypothetical protein